MPSAISLRPVPPFRLDLTAWALRRRPNNAIDRWDGKTYSRTLCWRERRIEIAVTQAGSEERPELRIEVGGRRPGADLEHQLAQTVGRLLGLSVDLRAFYAFAARDRRLAALASRFKGLKPPRFPGVFEALVNAIACQQLSLVNGLMLLNRLAGERASPRPAFPTPERVARMSRARLRAKGFSGAKALAILSLARALAKGRLDLQGLERLDDATAVEQLCDLRGVGRWSAEYVLLRGLGRTQVFPGDDVGARNRLKGWLGLRRPLDYERVGEVLERWRPYAGLIYFHLLLDGLAERGYVK